MTLKIICLISRADCGSHSGGYKTSSFQLSPHQTSSTPVGGRKRIKETRSISTPLSSVSIGKGSSSNSDTNSKYNSKKKISAN